jgi:hypothetical protein
MRSCRFSTLLAHKLKHTGIRLAKSRTSSDFIVSGQPFFLIGARLRSRPHSHKLAYDLANYALYSQLHAER